MESIQETLKKIREEREKRQQIQNDLSEIHAERANEKIGQSRFMGGDMGTPPGVPEKGKDFLAGLSSLIEGMRAGDTPLPPRAITPSQDQVEPSRLDRTLPLHEQPSQQAEPLSSAESILMEHIGNMFGMGGQLEKERERNEASERIASASGFPGMGRTPVEQSSTPANILAQVLGTGLEYMPYITAAAPVAGAASSAIGPAGTAVPKAVEIARQAIRGGVSLGSAQLLKNTIDGGMAPEDLEQAVLFGAIADPILSQAFKYIARAFKGTKLADYNNIIREGETPIDLNKYDQKTMKRFITEISRGNTEGAKRLLSEADGDLLVNLYSNSPSFKKTVIEIAKGHRGMSGVRVPTEDFIKSTGPSAPARPTGPTGVISEHGKRGMDALRKTGYQGAAMSPGPVAPEPGIGSAKLTPPPPEGPTIVAQSGMSPEAERAMIDRNLVKLRKHVQNMRSQGKMVGESVRERLRGLEERDALLREEAQRGVYPSEVVETGQERVVPPRSGYDVATVPPVPRPRPRVDTIPATGEPIEMGDPQLEPSLTTADEIIPEPGVEQRAKVPEAQPELQPVKQKPRGDQIKKARQDLLMAGSMQENINGVSIKIVANPMKEGNYGLQITVDGNRLQPNWESPLNNRSLTEAPNVAVDLLGDIQEGTLTKEDLLSLGSEQRPGPRRVERGTKSSIKTNAGDTLEVEYQLVDADDLIASHGLNFERNPAYPAELQPRERGRATAQTQVSQMLSKLDPERLGGSLMASEGAPIVGDDMVVESGNGRTLALQSMYGTEAGPARERYLSWLQNEAENFGIDSSTVGEYEKPVLVRKRITDVNRSKFAQDANESTVSLMSAAEQAQTDAKKITPDMLKRFNVSETGDVVAGNRDFLQDFAGMIPQNEAGRFAAADGQISQEGVQRVKNALFHKAFGDPTVLARMSESADDNVKGIINGLVQAAPRTALLQSLIDQGMAYPLTLAPETSRVVSTLSGLRAEGTKVSDFIDQGVLFGNELSPLEKKLLSFFDENKRSAKKIAQLYDRFAFIVEGKGDPRTAQLFETKAPTTEEVFDAALRTVSSSGQKDQGKLFFSEAAGSGSQRVSTGDAGTAGTGTEGEDVRQAMTASGDPRRMEMEPDRPTREPGSPPVEPIGVGQIKKAIDEMFLPWREKRLGKVKKSVAGWFNPRTKVMRSRYPGDITVALHELGHFLDSELGLHPRSPEALAELLSLGDATSAPGYTQDQIIMEGVAQFMQHWAINPAQASREAPVFLKEFNARMDKFPEVKDNLKQVTGLVKRYYVQDPTQRMSMHILTTADQNKIKPVIKDRIKAFTDKLYTDWVDQYYPVLTGVDRAVQEAINAPTPRDVPDQYRIYLQMRVAPGLLERARVDVEKYYKDILNKVHVEDAPALRRYLVAQHSLDYWNNDMNPGLGNTREEVEAIIEETPAEIREFAEQIWKLTTDVTSKTMVRTGAITKETLAEWKEKYPHYVPFVRAKKGAMPPRVRTGGKKIVNLAEPDSLKELTGIGSDAGVKEIVDPLESIPRMFLEYHMFRIKNDIASNFYDVSQIPGTGRIAEEVAGAPSQEDYTFSVWRKGKKVTLATTPDIYAAFTGLNEPYRISIPGEQLSRSIAMFAKKAFTRWNPAFAPRNFFRDSFDIVRNTQKKMPLLFKHSIDGLISVMKGDPYVAEAIENGILYSGITSRDLEEIIKAPHKIFSKTRGEQIESLANPKKWFEFVGSINNQIEMSPKFSEYKELRKQGYSKLEATVMAREGNIDFLRKGRLSKYVNQHVPFFDPQIQGVDKMARTTKEYPARTLFRMMFYVALPTLMIWSAYKDDEEYQSFDRRLKDNNWIFRLGDTWYRLPKPHDDSFLYSILLERGLDKAYEKDPGAMKGIMGAAKETFVPDIMPLVFSPIYQANLNRNLYFGSNIVPESKQDLPVEMQYGSHTSETAKTIGKMFKIAPYKVDFLIRSYAGSPGSLMVSGVEQIIETLAEEDQIPEPKKKWSEAPFIRSFTAEPYKGSGKVSDFYDIFEELEKGYNGARAKGEMYNKYAQYKIFTQFRKRLGIMWKNLAQVRESRMSAEKKRQQMDKIYIQAHRTAKQALDTYYKATSPKRGSKSQ